MLMTKYELNKKQAEALKKLINFCGTQSHLAKMIGVSPQLVAGWIIRGRISKKGARLVTEHETLGIVFSETQLRPDLEC